MAEITQILLQIEQGDSSATDSLMRLVYDELRGLAKSKLAGEKPGQTLRPTELVHETYLRIFGREYQSNFRNREHFFATAATAMRRILIDSARRKRTSKRGDGLQRVPLDDPASLPPDEDLIALNEALEQLAKIHPEKAKLVELRYFVGLTSDESAALIGISPSTADRYWQYARAWLKAAVEKN